MQLVWLACAPQYSDNNALFFSFPIISLPAQVPDSDEQFVPDFHSENCEWTSLDPCAVTLFNRAARQGRCKCAPQNQLFFQSLLNGLDQLVGAVLICASHSAARPSVTSEPWVSAERAEEQVGFLEPADSPTHIHTHTLADTDLRQRRSCFMRCYFACVWKGWPGPAQETSKGNIQGAGTKTASFVHIGRCKMEKQIPGLHNWATIWMTFPLLLCAQTMTAQDMGGRRSANTFFPPLSLSFSLVVSAFLSQSLCLVSHTSENNPTS